MEKDSLIVKFSAHDIEVPSSLSKGGNSWWILLDEDEPAYKGLIFEAAETELPKILTVNEVSVDFEPVPKWNPSTNSESNDLEPFDRTRRYHGLMNLNGQFIKVQSRITVRRDQKWNFSFKAWKTARTEDEKSGGLYDLI